MKNIAIIRHLFIVFLFINIVRNSNCGICEMCVCFQSDDLRIVNCEGKREIDNYTEIFDLLAFDDYKTVGKLILSKHEITSLPLDAFRGQQRLRSLDLSENSITDFEADIFKDLTSLEELDFSFNSLTALSGAVFNNIQSLLKLNLSNNQITDLNDTTSNQLPKLTHLDISHNSLATFDSGFIKSLTNLKFFDISFNRIKSLSGGTLLQLQSLSQLRVTNNLLEFVSGQNLPASLVELDIGHNMITSLPLDLSQVRFLNIEDNRIAVLQTNATWYQKIKHLNISGNRLTTFPDTQFSDLKTLDISRNKLSNIPETMSSNNLPALETLLIDANPMKSLKFNTELRLRNLFIRSVSELEIIDSDTFVKLIGFDDECVNLTISGNPRLNKIKKGAFSGIEICSLDLRDNAITRISPDVVEYQNKFIAHNYIDLQGNPFNCDCDSQWMLNVLIPHLYNINPELLENLRCKTPSELSGMRMVHWYKWKEQVFCDTKSQILSRMTVETAAVLAGNESTIKLESSRGMLAVIAGAIGVLCTLIIVGVLVARKLAIRRRRINRRF